MRRASIDRQPILRPSVAATVLKYSDSSPAENCTPSLTETLCGFGASVRSRGASLEVVQDEQADCRRRVALLTIGIDLANQLGQRHAALLGNLLHAAPKWLFEAHARLVAVGEN